MSSLETWCDARPLDRKVIGVRMAGRWVVALVDGSGEPRVGAGRSLHDALEAAEDELEASGPSGQESQRPPSAAPARSAPVCPSPEVLCSCGETFVWGQAELLGMQVDDAERLELRNCPHCYSTRALAVTDCGAVVSAPADELLGELGS